MQEMILEAEIIDEPLDQPAAPQPNRNWQTKSPALIDHEPKPKLPAQAPQGRITVPCPKCSFLLECDSKLEGTRGMCPKCKSLFTISRDPEACKLLPKIDFAFACPSCNQLFEGKPEMEGRKGKCPGCKAVFLIERHISNELGAKLSDLAMPKPTVNSMPSAAPTEIPPLDEFVLDFEPEISVPPQQSHAPKKPRSSPSLLPSQAKSAPPPPPPIKPKPIPERLVVIVCPGCNAHLEVPSSGAGKMTICPACRTQMQIPADV